MDCNINFSFIAKIFYKVTEFSREIKAVKELFGILYHIWKNWLIDIVCHTEIMISRKRVMLFISFWKHFFDTFFLDTIFLFRGSLVKVLMKSVLSCFVLVFAFVHCFTIFVGNVAEYWNAGKWLGALARYGLKQIWLFNTLEERIIL